MQTNNPLFKEGETFQGSVLVDKIAPTLTIPRLDGSKSEITADAAYHVTYRFGTEEQTRGLGLLIWNEVYIDFETQKYKGDEVQHGLAISCCYFQQNN